MHIADLYPFAVVQQKHGLLAMEHEQRAVPLQRQILHVLKVQPDRLKHIPLLFLAGRVGNMVRQADRRVRVKMIHTRRAVQPHRSLDPRSGFECQPHSLLRIRTAIRQNTKIA
ncbi:hypothetical protein D3C73_1201560 [compost metagenome]